MVITQGMAQPIVNRLREVLSGPLNIINHEGIIVASTDPIRINTFHAGAVQAMDERRELLVYSPVSQELTGTRTGITLPIEFHGEYVGAVGITGDPDELAGAAAIIKVAVVSLIEQTYVTQQSNYQRKILDNWVNNLITERVEDLDQLRQQAEFLDIDLRRHCNLLVISTKPMVYHEFSMYEEYIQKVVHNYAKIHFFAYVGQGQYVLATQAREKQGLARLQQMCEALERKLEGLNQKSYIGVGKPMNGLAGYRQSYFDALHSVRIVERLGGEKRIIYYFEHQIFRLLESVPHHTKLAFLDNYLDEREIEPVLFETLETYFEMDKHLNETADALHIHRNTLIFRLNKTRDLYGLDPRRFLDSMALQMILYMLKFPELARDENTTPWRRVKEMEGIL